MKHKFLIELESEQSASFLKRYLKDAIEHSDDPSFNYFRKKLKLKIRRFCLRIPGKLTIKEAKEQGFLIDFDTYTAYKGDIHKPTDTRNVYTEFEEELLRFLGEIK